MITFWGINLTKRMPGLIVHPTNKDGAPVHSVHAIPFSVLGFVGVGRVFFCSVLRSSSVDNGLSWHIYIILVIYSY
jgi:hypothetical protein